MSQLLQNAAYGTVLILAVALLRRVLGNRLIPEARLALWAVCLFRLITPAAPESVLSLWGLLSRLVRAEEVAPAAPAAPQLYVLPQAVPTPQPEPGISWKTVLIVLWLAVGTALVVRYVLNWRRTRRAVACAIPLDRSDARYAALPRCARLREGPMEGAPLTFGALRPTVVLSPGLDGAELDCVLAHEGVHAARRDNLWHYVMALAMVVHWWNPAVWLMSRLLRRDIELSCDRAAVRKLGTDRRADYACALVSLATQAEGPAFSQTFGRKAAEERILAIMKFKKTSLIGVIFTLALVLAVTAAFASEPKESDEYDNVKVGEFTYVFMADGYTVGVSDIQAAIQSGFPKVDPDSVDLSMMKELLAQKVADGEITQEEADQRLAAVEEILDLARRGELELFMTMATDENGCEFPYGSGVGTMYYKEGDGNLVAMDPGKTASSYVLEFPIYVEDSESIVEADRRLLGEGVVIYDGDIEHPVIYKNGYSVSADGGIIGQKFYDYNFVADGSAASGSVVRTCSGTYELCTAKDCDVPYSHFHLDGVVVRVYQEYPGPLCTLPDCANDEPHEHSGVQYAGKAPEAYTVLVPDLEPAPSDAPVSPAGQSTFPRNSKGSTYGSIPYGSSILEEPDLVGAVGTNGESGYVRASDLRGPAANVTNPYEAMAYMRRMATLPSTIFIPLYDSEENVIGQFAIGNSVGGADPLSIPCGLEGCTETRYHAHNEGRTILLNDPCPVEGCTITGNHIHDGVSYSCNGAGHSIGFCDGSCYTYD